MLMCVCSAACANRSSGQQQTQQQWTTGFWFWHGGGAVNQRRIAPVDVLYFRAGTIQRATYLRGSPIEIGNEYPDHLPPANEYWMVFRYEAEGIPPERVGSDLISRLKERRIAESKRGRHITGIQLDVDSPTGSLAGYAKFLKAFRRELPRDMQLSITALLDWFRSGTAVGDVIREVDEFVPQFYDVQPSRDGAIAARFDGARWGSMLSGYKKRFRIGISTFGRARLLDVPTASYIRIADLPPFDVASSPDFQLQTNYTDAREVRLHYRATRRVRLGYPTIEAGQVIEFTLATPEAIRAAVAQARLTGPYCAGVVFFRWPSYSETMAMQPEEVLEAAGVIPPSDGKPQVQAVNASCAAVFCVDLYVAGLDRYTTRPARFRIDSSEPLEYFIPKEKSPARMSAASQIAFTLPAYTCRNRILLGRAIARKPAQFSLQETP